MQQTPSPSRCCASRVTFYSAFQLSEWCSNGGGGGGGAAEGTEGLPLPSSEKVRLQSRHCLFASRVQPSLVDALSPVAARKRKGFGSSLLLKAVSLLALRCKLCPRALPASKSHNSSATLLLLQEEPTLKVDDFFGKFWVTDCTYSKLFSLEDAEMKADIRGVVICK